jgi:hypothetical protein
MVARPPTLGLDIVTRPKDLGSDVVARPKQTINKQRIIVHFNCQEREKKRKHKQSITNGNPTMMCIYKRPTMWKRVRLCIYLYGE